MNSWVEEIIKIVDKAVPLNNTIRAYYDYAVSENHTIVNNGATIEISNESKWLRVSSYKDIDRKIKLCVRVSTGATMTVAINEKEYAMLNLSIINCVSRFNDNIITFCQNFYEH